MIGRTLAHYQILARLGEGGMGVVYKARDTHLDRFVAIKVLRPDKIADAERKRRFVQEAKAASALNHPNIVHVYDIAEAEGIDYIAMEYVQGRTLDQLIGRKGLKFGDTLKYGVQIADALSRAHAAGIIHRDLKPGNIIVDEHGLVKVVDFGLAKLTETSPSSDEDLTLTRRDTTGEGVIVGTVAYMSPEQAEGKPVDSRSDVFALGAVLYEMATGHKAFAGESQMSTLAAVINQDPAPLPQEMPRDLSKIIVRSLRKDPDRRFHHMADVRVALQELKEESDSGTLAAAHAPAAPRGKTAAAMIGSLVAFMLVAAGGYVAWHAARPPAPPPRTVQLTAYSGQEVFPSFAPDGKHVAFTWDGDAEDNEDIYIKLVGSEARRRLTTDAAPDRVPAWSPDGTEIAFVREGAGGLAIYVMSESGGSERKVTDLKLASGIGATPAISWADAHTLVTAETGPDGTSGIFLVPVTGGEKRALLTAPASAGRYYAPVFSPDRSILAFSACTGERA